MRILICHNQYQQPGGEDLCVQAETEILEEHGHDVRGYARHNDEIESMSQLRVGAASLWNPRTYWDLSRLFRSWRPEIVHLHNVFPLISAAVYDVAKRAGIPVVQTIHNYRFACLNGLFYRDGRVCQDCLGRLIAWPGVKHRCYHESVARSTAVAGAVAVTKSLRRKVDVFVAPSEFTKQTMIRARLPEDRIVVKPNFLRNDPGAGEGRGNFALFVGRASPEKGLDTLIEAWHSIGDRLPLRIVGDGPQRAMLANLAGTVQGIEWLGSQPHDKVIELLREATCVVCSSEWHETFGRVIVESFARGTPVVGSNIGAIPELIDDGRTGILFEPGCVDGLVSAVERLVSEPSTYAELRRAARVEFLQKYTAGRNYDLLIDVYHQAIGRVSTGSIAARRI